MEEIQRIKEFINSFNVCGDQELEVLRKESEEGMVPIIRKEMENFLRVLFTLKKPKRILELGTAVGYSSLIMSKYMDEDAKILTIENYEPRIIEAKANFKRFGVEDRITLCEGDCLEILKGLDGEFDFIFMDAAKGQYLAYLKECLRLMPKDAILLTDNILCDNEIIKSKYAVNRRDRTIHERMREYLYEITHNDMLITSLIPLGDGVSLSIRTEK